MIRAFFDSGRAARARGLRVALPAVALALLAGCVTSDYRYREDHGGGYYYGTPSVEYRELTPYPYGPYAPYGYGPYGAYGPYGYGAYGPYGPYRYVRSPYGGYYVPYYGRVPYGAYPYGHPYRQAPRPRTDATPDRPRSPWRDLDHLRPRVSTQPPGGMLPPPAPATTPFVPRGGGPGERIRRAKERASGREDTP